MEEEEEVMSLAEQLIDQYLGEAKVPQLTAAQAKKFIKKYSPAYAEDPATSRGEVLVYFDKADKSKASAMAAELKKSFPKASVFGPTLQDWKPQMHGGKDYGTKPPKGYSPKGPSYSVSFEVGKKA